MRKKTDDEKAIQIKQGIEGESEAKRPSI